jgi:MFS family permease
MRSFFRLLRYIAYPLAAFPRGTYMGFVNSLFPLYLATFTQNTALIGVLVTISACEGALTPLVIGPLTDRTTSRFGRRKIYIFVGTVLTFFLVLVYPLATNLSALVAVVILAGLAFSISGAPHLAMVTRNSGEETRTQTVALLSIFYLAGQVTIIILNLTLWNAHIDTHFFILLAAGFVLLTTPFFLYSADDSRPSAQSERFSMRKWLSFFTDTKRNIYMISQALLWFGINSVVPFFVLFVTSYLLLSQKQAILLYLVIILATGIWSYPFALIGRRFNEMRVFQVGLVFLLVAGFIGIFASHLPVGFLYVIAFCAGTGYASTVTFSFSIFSKIVPEEFIGTAGGVNAFLISGIAPLAAFLSGLMIAHFTYPIMFVILIIMTFMSIVLIEATRRYGR